MRQLYQPQSGNILHCPLAHFCFAVDRKLSNKTWPMVDLDQRNSSARPKLRSCRPRHVRLISARQMQDKKPELIGRIQGQTTDYRPDRVLQWVSREPAHRSTGRLEFSPSVQALKRTRTATALERLSFGQRNQARCEDQNERLLNRFGRPICPILWAANSATTVS